MLRVSYPTFYSLSKHSRKFSLEEHYFAYYGKLSEFLLIFLCIWMLVFHSLPGGRNTEISSVQINCTFFLVIFWLAPTVCTGTNRLGSETWVLKNIHNYLTSLFSVPTPCLITGCVLALCHTDLVKMNFRLNIHHKVDKVRSFVAQ